MQLSGQNGNPEEGAVLYLPLMGARRECYGQGTQR